MTFQSGAAEEIRLALNSEQAATSAQFTVMPHAGNPTGPNKVLNRQESDEVRSDLQVADHILTGANAAFSFSNPARPDIYDICLQMVMGSAWTSAVSVTGTDIASAATGNKFTSVTATKFTALTAQVPCPVWITRDGATPLATFAIATSVENSETELVIGDGTAGNDFGVTLTVVAAGDNVEIMHSGVLKPGTTDYYAIIERAMTSLTQFYAGFGMMCTSFGFNFSKSSIPTYSVSFEGRDADDATATYGTGTDIAASTSSPFNAADDIQFFGINGLFTTAFDTGSSAQDLFLSAFELNIEVGAIPTDAMGQLGRYSHCRDTVRFAGSLSLFANDDARTVQARAGDDTDDSLFFALKQDNGTTWEGLCFWAPRIQYNTPDKQSGGRGNKVRHQIPWMSAVDATYSLSGCIARFTAAPVS